MRRDSFSDRICDDLCEVLIKYLSFEDKIRFECVSKQFQRCVYSKQYKLQINIDYKGNKNSLIELYPYHRSSYDSKVNFKAFKSVLKKCKFINEIELYGDQLNYDPVLDLISENCKHLKILRFDFNHSNEESIRNFASKCGQKLETIDFLDVRVREGVQNYLTIILKNCPNLVSIKSRMNLKVLDDLLLPKLESVEIHYLNNESQLFKTFAQNHKNSLKSLKFEMSDEITQIEQNFIMKEMIALPNLESLDIRYSYWPSIEINVESLGFFKNLKSLTLFIKQGFDFLLIKSLKDCKQLIRLYLRFTKVDDNFFKDIHLYLPQLKCLYLSTSQVKNIAFSSITKLKKLNTIIIEKSESSRERIKYAINFSRITDKPFRYLINNCPQIRLTLFSNITNITNKTIKELIALAERNPRIQYKYFFVGNYRHLDIYNLPNNLIINSYRSLLYSIN